MLCDFIMASMSARATRTIFFVILDAFNCPREIRLKTDLAVKFKARAVCGNVRYSSGLFGSAVFMLVVCFLKFLPNESAPNGLYPVRY